MSDSCLTVSLTAGRREAREYFCSQWIISTAAAALIFLPVFAPARWKEDDGICNNDDDEAAG